MSDLLKDLADIRDRIDLAMDAVRGKAAAPADEVGEPKAIGCPQCKLIYECDGNRMFFCPRHGDDPEQSSIVGIGRNGTETRWWTHLLGPDVEPLWSGLKLAVTAGFVALTPHQQKFAATTAEKRAALGKPEAVKDSLTTDLPGPCNCCGQPDAVAKAAIAMADAFEAYFASALPDRNDTWGRFRQFADAYRATKGAASVDGAGNGVQS